MVIAERSKAHLIVVRSSEFTATCQCEDHWRHKEYDQSVEEFKTRKVRSRDVRVVGYDTRYGSVVVNVQTVDKRGRREYQVYLGRGDGDSWCCKHIIASLRSRALMPQYKNKTVVFSQEIARRLQRMYAGRLVKSGRQPDVLVTRVNNSFVVGWWRVDN